MSYTQQLYQLQQVDSQIDANNRRLEEIAANLVETDALKTAKKEFSQAQAEHKQCRTIVTDLDLEVKGLQQKITQHERRLYSGKLVNPKEASSLQDEIASTKRWHAKREEDLLEAMIELESAEEALKNCEQVLAKVTAGWEADQADLLAEQKQLTDSVAQLTRSRPALVTLVNPADLKRYELLRSKKAGVAVAAVEDSSCRSCGVMLNSKLVQQADIDNKLYFCENCGRIIHIL